MRAADEGKPGRQAQPQFYIQLAYKSHFGILNSSVWAAQGSKEKKVDLSFSEQLLRVVFPTFCGQKKCLKFF